MRGLHGTLVHPAGEGESEVKIKPLRFIKLGRIEMVDFVLISGRMHTEVHWKRTSGAVLHLPDGGGPDSFTQWSTRLRQQPPERRPTAPLCHWRVHQPARALSAVFVFGLHALLCFYLPVEGSEVGCGKEPVVAQETPAGGTRLTILPYHQVKFNVNFMSRAERFVGF